MMDWLTPRSALAQSHYIYDTILTTILNDTKRLTRKLSKCYKTLKKKRKWMTRKKANDYYVNVFWFWFWVLFPILLLPLPLVIKLGYLGEGNHNWCNRLRKATSKTRKMKRYAKHKTEKRKERMKNRTTRNESRKKVKK